MHLRDREQRRRLSTALRARVRELGFEKVGITRLRPSDHAAFYRAWIERGYHGEMRYLARDDALAARLDPRSRWPELVSAVVVAQHYSGSGSSASTGRDAGASDPTTNTTTTTKPAAEAAGTGIIARYARGRDYHKVVKKKLMALLRWLEEELGEELPAARAYVDTGPILERELGRRAGLGWFGRNTMLIDPERGSYFFLGELLLPFELDYDEPFEADRCGSCTACIPACPTDALLGRDDDGAPVMDATRCISYLTIENTGAIPEELRPLMGNRVFGCDICQEACPFVQRFTIETSEPDYAPRRAGEAPHGVEPISISRVADGEGSPRTSEASGTPQSSNRSRASGPLHPGTDSPSLVELLRTARDPEAWDAFSRGSAIRRAGRAGFARNVCVAIGNWLASVGEPPEAAAAVLREALEDPEPLVREHAAWALGRV